MMGKNKILLVWLSHFLLNPILTAQIIGVQDTAAILRPILITEVPQFTERTNRLELETIRFLDPPPSIQTIKNDLPDAISEIETKKANLLDSTQSFSLSQLENFKRDWDNIQERISNWKERKYRII